MKKIAVSVLLMTQLVSLSGAGWAAERYTQVYSNQYNTNWNGYTPSGTQIAQTQVQGQVQTTRNVSGPQAILDKLKSANQVPAEIKPNLQIERSDTLNAATDGQNLMITDTLLNKLTTDDERAFVISHELAHILLSHIGKTQVRRTGLSLLDLFVRNKAGSNSILTMASELGIGLIDLKSSRGYEYQADDLGVKLMTNAGYNPQAALKVFDILEANSPSNGKPGFLLSHPISRDRVKALVQKYKLSLQ